MGDQLIDYFAIYAELSQKFEQLGDFAEAASCAKRLVHHYPGLVLSWERYGAALLKADRLEEADAAFSYGFSLDPHYPPLALAYSRRLKDKGEFKAALDILEPVSFRMPYSEPVTALMCDILQADGKAAKARELAESFLIAHPISFFVRLSLLRILITANDPLAAECFLACREQAVKERSHLTALAELLIELKRFSDSISILQGPLQTSGTVNELLLFADALEAVGNASVALTMLQQTVKRVSHKNLGEKTRIFSRKLRPAGSSSNQRRVLLISVQPRVREAKIARALKLSGWEPILLYNSAPNYEISRFFDGSAAFANPEDALTIADSFDAPIHHVFSLAADPVACAFIREKLACTIFDASDTYEGLIYDRLELHGAQRYLHTHADGLVCRDAQTRTAARLGGYRYAKPVLYFPEFGWGAPEQKAAPRAANEIHVVQTGWIDIERYSGVKHGNCLEFVSAFAKAGIHVHLYQHMFARGIPLAEVYQDFLAVGKATERVHIHPNIPLDEVVSALAQYDIGLLTGLSPDEPLPEGYQWNWNPQGFRGGASARCADYMEAGLPVIISGIYRLQQRSVSRHGLCIPFTKELLRNPREILAPYCNAKTREIVRQKSATFTLAHHAPRLIRFYERCLAERGPAGSREIAPGPVMTP